MARLTPATRRWAAFRQMNPSIFFGRRELGAISGILYLVQQIKKCGYVPETAVNHANESPLIYNDNNSGDRYIRDGGTTYTGPGSSGYVSAGSVDAGELVAYTGYKYNDYALIEYSVGSTSNKKRAWYSAGDMTTEPASSGSTFYNYTANGWTVTSPWNGTADHPGHLGLDLVRSSNTSFYALADGVVVAKSSSCLRSNGYTIVLQHNIGGKPFFSFLCAHGFQPEFECWRSCNMRYSNSRVWCLRECYWSASPSRRLYW